MKNLLFTLLLISLVSIFPHEVRGCTLRSPDYLISQNIASYKIVFTDGADGAVGIITGRELIPECGYVEEGFSIRYLHILIIAGLIVVILILSFGFRKWFQYKKAKNI